jgi:hypothetical protein
MPRSGFPGASTIAMLKQEYEAPAFPSELALTWFAVDSALERNGEVRGL